MMLVEILARELNEWPSDCTGVEQAVDGDICADRDATRRNFRHLDVALTRAEDWVSAYVTRAQWEAERARILAESQPERDTEIAKIVDPCDGRSKEEQELWDKVALKSLHGILASPTSWDEEGVVECSTRIADLFMAERAKRLKAAQ